MIFKNKSIENPITDSWYLVYEGRRLLHLKNPKFLDMFWFIYDVKFFDLSEEEKARLATPEFWASPEVSYHLAANTSKVAKNAFAGGDVHMVFQSNQVSMRGLYLDEPSFFRFGSSRVFYFVAVLMAFLFGFFSKSLCSLFSK